MPQREDEDDDESLILFPKIPAPRRTRGGSCRCCTRRSRMATKGVKRNFLWNLDSSAFVSSTFRSDGSRSATSARRSRTWASGACAQSGRWRRMPTSRATEAELETDGRRRGGLWTRWAPVCP
ncbi:hypothetical protein C2845_PM15G21060 [Panicum miliaceum]|uniref:Uncharacterized protein n=1 Tax=Panicum miliaceum TaxID=4540 RepID=A0A3L6QBT5_PANMI|nr:hypothetical protein C2845_PM15G21060 [Panicum miliaceum]